MKRAQVFIYTALVLLFTTAIRLTANPPSANKEDIAKLDNPMSVAYLKKNLRKSEPRLVLNSLIERELKQKLQTDPVIRNIYEAIKLNARSIQGNPLLERIQTGKRLLSVSREMLYRMNMLGMVYRMERDPVVLQRINEEVVAVCNFSDWNPSHFLDVAEMALAVAIALDWTAGDLPRSTIDLAKKALIEKGIKPSWPESGNNPGWVTSSNNWNQVCNGGLIAASIAIAEVDPELAAKTIHRALDGIPHALAEYGPDGVYPEGSTYWSYGTSFSVITAAMLESAFGTDFGHLNYPGFKESAVFRVLTNAPSGWYYNFADCGDRRSEQGDFTLAWFAAKTGNRTFFEKERFLMPPDEMGKLSRLAGAALVWIARFEEKHEEKIPTAWKGEGANPVVIFTGGENDPHQYYFGGKGGRGMVNHGNMDGGSFIFELNGVRWSIDPGNQNYHELEKIGFNLWGRCQTCERWTLLTKNNYGHSTLTINDSLHRTEGLVTLTDFKTGNRPEAIFDMSATLGNLVSGASRKFVKESPTSILIEDDIRINENTKLITWQMITTADAETVDGGIVLKQDGQTLKMENLSHPDLTFSVVSLYPAPLEYDRQIKGLKRVELRIPAWTVDNGKTNIKVRLSGTSQTREPLIEIDETGQTESVVRVIEIDSVWAGHPVGFCLRTHENRQYIAYYNANRNMVVGQRNTEDPDFSLSVMQPTSRDTHNGTSTVLGWDSHNYITFAFDREGYIHLAGNMHNHPLTYFRSSRPNDIFTLEQVMEMIGSEEKRCTYPNFMTDRNGELIFYYRDGGSGNGNTIYNIYDIPSKSWKRLLDVPLTDGQGLMNAYQSQPALLKDNWYHVYWVWRDTPDCETNHDLSYMKSPDLKNWFNAFGEPVELPATIENRSLIVDPVPPGGGIINLAARLCLDENLSPLFVYHKYDDTGNLQLFVAKLQEKGWVSKQITDWDYRWEFSGRGTIIFEVRLNSFRLRPDGYFEVGYEHIKYGNGTILLDNALNNAGRVLKSVSFGENLKVEGDFPGLQVRTSGDIGRSNEPGVRYILKWETLPQNRDRARPEPWPDPARLYLYKLKKDKL